MSSAGEEVEASTLITLRVKDNEGVRITCTMSRTDKLRVLIGFYLDMVTPTDKDKGAAVAAAAGGGVRAGVGVAGGVVGYQVLGAHG